MVICYLYMFPAPFLLYVIYFFSLQEFAFEGLNKAKHFWWTLGSGSRIQVAYEYSISLGKSKKLFPRPGNCLDWIYMSSQGLGPGDVVSCLYLTYSTYIVAILSIIVLLQMTGFLICNQKLYHHLLSRIFTSLLIHNELSCIFSIVNCFLIKLIYTV